ncbi:acyltransferase [Methylobacillus sp. MM3]|jgi:outer membrane lipoprotein-sorting protein|uniref:LolA-related protein n=1 Tax=Methylobacillus sp. MM3 TaxID=1848039 RepID=UPI0007DFA4B5|nr:LolA-related protein [Methylobacillus sp. MM3]OAJ71197.1 acyltransferase [Methylobacillus sp. MM3]
MNIVKSFLMLACLLVSSSLQAGEWSIDQLMNGLAQTRSGHASFIEKKSIAILDRPVESSGELFYTAPGRLEKRTLKPRPESMVLEQGTLTIEQKGKRHVLPLQNYPEIAAFIESIRGTLAGDRAALERAYHLNLEGGEQGWTLELLPLADRMKKVVERIRIAGERHELRTIEIRQADGDSSLMTITQMSAP